MFCFFTFIDIMAELALPLGGAIDRRRRQAAFAWAGNQLLNYGARRLREYINSDNEPQAKKQKQMTKGMHEIQPITFQDQTRMIYRRRRAPRYVRKRAIRFARRTQSVLAHNLPVNQVTIRGGVQLNTSLVNANSHSATQDYISCLLYPWTGYTRDTLGNSDMFNLWNNINDLFVKPTSFGIDTVPPTTNQAQDGKLIFDSAIMDVQLLNPATTGCQVQVYEIIARSKLKGKFSGPEGWMTNPQGRITTGTVDTIASYQMTPFDFPNFGSEWLILKSREINLAAGQSASLQIRDSKNRYVDTDTFYNKWQNDGGVTGGDVALAGMTKGYFFVVTGVPTYNSTTMAVSASTLNVTCVKTYKFRVLNNVLASMSSL